MDDRHFNSSRLLDDTNVTISPADLVANASTAAAPMSKTIAATLFYVNTVAGGALSVFGILGNIMVITVFTLHKPITPTSIMLRGLAVSDALFLLTTFLYKPMLGIYFHLGQATFYAKNIYTCMIQYLRPIMYSLQHISTWLVVVVAVDRHFAVCRPLQSKSQRHAIRTRARRTVLTVYLVCFVFNIPRFFEYETKVTQNENRPMCKPEVNPFVKKNRFYIIFYCWTLYFLVMYVVPIVTATVINVKLILSLRQARKQRAFLRERQTHKVRRYNTTRLLIIVVMVFIGCQTPDFVLQVFYFINVLNPMKIKQSLDVFSKVTDTLLTLNAAVNFLIYCAIGTSFRKTLTDLLMCKITRKTKAKFPLQLKLFSVESTFSTSLSGSAANHLRTRKKPSNAKDNNAHKSLYKTVQSK
ncbi:probable G-protein coupled receptor 139 [Lingula anatina]|uniref:Probable G-protein coupled receptor 139 n=1 Tax=Lingula anatina TaxID=7574 RepID=A0A1S3I844_LINAN|nr:probable G-protein coupled receptor 139 [Lingula anatina]|eukprot:XP_013394427.1 probable G-protein coupled receptor 139 [Lingula anatina]